MVGPALRDPRWSTKASRYLNGRVQGVIGRLGVTATAIVFVPSRWARAVAAIGSPYRPDWKAVSLEPLVIELSEVTSIDLALPPALSGMPGPLSTLHIAIREGRDEYFLLRGSHELDPGEAMKVLRRAVEASSPCRDE